MISLLHPEDARLEVAGFGVSIVGWRLGSRHEDRILQVSVRLPSGRDQVMEYVASPTVGWFERDRPRAPLLGVVVLPEDRLGLLVHEGLAVLSADGHSEFIAFKHGPSPGAEMSGILNLDAATLIWRGKTVILFRRGSKPFVFNARSVLARAPELDEATGELRVPQFVLSPALEIVEEDTVVTHF